MKRSLLISSLAFGIMLGASPAFAGKYKVIEVKDGGTITGKVTFKGDDPAPKVFAITKDPETCGKGDREIDFVKVKDGGLGDAVVFLAKVKEGKAFPEGLSKGGVNQEGCAFQPFIQVIQNGGEFDAKNSDPVSHNIHTYEIMGRAKKTIFNISQPDKGDVVKKIKLKRGDGMKIECDQHDFMHGFAFVAKNPYFALVAEDGTYKIENVPAGKYKIKSWHGTLGEKKGKVEVSAGGEATVDFEYSAK